MKIKVSRGRTINVGDFNSERIDVGIEMVIPNDSVISKCLETLHEEVEEFLDEKTDKIKEEHSSRRD